MDVIVQEGVYTAGFVNPNPTLPPDLSGDTPGTLYTVGSTQNVEETLYASFIPLVDFNTPVLNGGDALNTIIVLAGTQNQETTDIAGYIPLISTFQESVFGGVSSSGGGPSAPSQSWYFS